MKLAKFNTFEPSVNKFAKKIGLVGESHDLPELFGTEKSRVVLQIAPNDFSTYQVFQRLSGSKFVPTFVSNRIDTRNLKTPITVISPISEIRTFATRRQLNSETLSKNSLYFNTPRINEQFQVTATSGKILGARQIIDGKPIHINTNRYHKMSELHSVITDLHEHLGSELIRARIGFTSNGPLLLAMENFKLAKPELANLYVSIYEDFIGPMPDWFKHHIESTMVIPYLNEYINRQDFKKEYPYIL